jgi:hypothetical protein
VSRTDLAGCVEILGDSNSWSTKGLSRTVYGYIHLFYLSLTDLSELPDGPTDVTKIYIKQYRSD